jgi:MFS family permease
MDRNIVMLYAVNFCIAIAFGLFFFLPAFIGSLHRPEYIAGTLISSAGVGAIVSISLSQRFIARFSSKSLLTLAFALYAIGSLLYAVSTQYSGLFYLYSFLVGCGWGLSYNVLPYQLSLLISNKAKIARFFNFYSAFGVLGTSLGPVAVHFFLKNLQTAWSTIFFMAMSFAIIALVFCSFIGFKSDIPHHNPEEKIRLPTVIFLPLAIIFVNACICLLYTSDAADDM